MKLSRRSILAASGLTVAAAAVAALAAPGFGPDQTIDGMDIAKIRARAAEQEKEQGAFAREIARRGDAVRQDAAQTRDAAMQNVARVKPDPRGLKDGRNGLSLDQMLADNDAVAKASKDAQPRFIAFASLSMPPASLRQLMREVGGSGGIVVFRGFPQNSSKAFLAGLGKAVDKGQHLNGVGIDPRLFRAFKIDAVPTYVVVSTDFKPCDGFNCETPVPPHDRMTGNVTPGYALRTFAQGGGPGAAIAKVYLASLEKLQRQ
ncbi:type-F conjugative transfer system pilin assembly protein TrbC [Sphingomonas sp. TZW2008]|uniref:type-F conjugative transfer system pilin assembly protein TrbC n=1 Tax=Sphingomonas sp. TZW2008 TaxID=1917973 RepID=UPI000A26875F|nr:type-F conjugative transfer system pilin assembly protein TrbC [Sphingomonas sp. TZW2008]